MASADISIVPRPPHSPRTGLTLLLVVVIFFPRSPLIPAPFFSGFLFALFSWSGIYRGLLRRFPLEFLLSEPFTFDHCIGHLRGEKADGTDGVIVSWDHIKR